MAHAAGAPTMNRTLVIAEAGVNHNGDLQLPFQEPYPVLLSDQNTEK